MRGNTNGLVLEHFEDDGTFPNSWLPLLLYRAAIAADEASPEAMEALLRPAAGRLPGARASSPTTTTIRPHTRCLASRPAPRA